MLVFLAIIVLLLLMIIMVYNRLVKLRNHNKNGFHQINVQLQRRTDLIPNLVETVKGYLKHEKKTLEAVIRARSALQKADSPGEKAQANDMLSSTLKSLFAVVENYPQLKANENFLRLQEEITTTENQVAFARQYYNDSVMKYNTAIESFPQSLIAAMCNFRAFHYFKTESAAARKAPKVKF
ncbi:LemA family protein [bacterium]|nr:LemA family protein [bacterium]